MAQSSPDTLSSRWSIGLCGGAGLGYRTLSIISPSATADAIVSMRNDREEPRLAFDVRAMVGYRITRHFGLEAGVGYFRTGWQQRVDATSLTFGDMIDPRRGFIYQTSDVITASSWILAGDFHYVEVPMGATWSIGSGRWRSISALGVAPAVLIAARGTTVSEFPDGRREKETYDATEKFKAFNLFPYFSTALAFRPWENWELRLQPMVRYGALRLIDAPITGHAFMGTVDLGVCFTL